VRAGSARILHQALIDTDVVKRERPLADVVAASGVVLRGRRGGGRLWGLCPFHQERTPSFCVDVRDRAGEHFHCFGCGAHGDVISFVMEREGCSFVEACERLWGRGRPPSVHPQAVERVAPAGLRWESLAPESPERRVVELACEVYHQRFLESPTGREYVRRRGVPDGLACEQRLGYADGHALIERLRRESLLEVGRRLGLVLDRPREWGGGAAKREFFAQRVVIPELRQGRAIWLTGRALEPAGGPHGERSRRPKYLSLAGERPLLGLDHVQGRRVVYVVEGPFDWLAARAWGLPAFCTCGTHVPPKRLPALDAAVAVYGVFDPDRAGRGATERLAPLFGDRWRPVRLPDGLDLAELAALEPHGREIFDALVARARADAWSGRPSAATP
jgi:DNA primase